MGGWDDGMEVLVSHTHTLSLSLSFELRKRGGFGRNF